MSALRLFEKFAKLLDVSWGSIADEQLLKRSGTNIIGVTALPPANCPAGTVIQTKHVETGAEVIDSRPAGDGPPFVITSGTEFLSLPITPLVATSKILIMGSGMVSGFRQGGGAGRVAVLLFAGSTWIVGTYIGQYSDNMSMNWSFEVEQTPGAGAITYSLRVSCLEPMDSHINGYTYVSGGYNPVTSMTLLEIKQ